MKIRVYGTPNKYAKVRVMNPATHSKILKKVFRFDENGVAEVETDGMRQRIVRAVMRRYKYEIVDDTHSDIAEPVIEQEVPVRVYKCKQCEAEFDAPYKLAQHARKEHPKNKGES